MQILPGVHYSMYRLSIIVVALLVALFLYLVIMRTRIGMLVRAGASNREMTGALGVNIKLLYTFVFGIGAALAGLAGLMQAAILTAQIGMGENILILAFVVIIIGGIGSIRGAFVASIFVGLVDTIGRAFLPDAAQGRAEPGRGLDGGAGAVVDADLPADGGRAGACARRACSRRPADDRRAHARATLAVAALLALPGRCCRSTRTLIGNLFLLSLFTRIVILAMAAVSLNLIMGFGGMVSFGHAAYIGIGGYVVGILAHEGVPSGFVQWPLALVVSALFALAIGALSLRTRGVYFIMITLAFAQMIYYVAVGARPLRRRRRPHHLPPQPVRRPRSISPTRPCSTTCAWRCCSAPSISCGALVNSRFGLVIQGARSNDRRMNAIGFPTFRYRLACFVIAGTHLRPLRRAARQPHRFHQPGHDALDALGRPHRHGGARRHGHRCSAR